MTVSQESRAEDREQIEGERSDCLAVTGKAKC